MRLLEVLAEAGGETVPRGELLDWVWPNVIVSDESLTLAVSEVRRKLGDKSLIATVSRGGYRLTVPVLHEVPNAPLASEEGPDTFSLEAYALCIEAEACFGRGGEGAHREFARLAAKAAAEAPDFSLARMTHGLALAKRHIFWSEGASLLETAEAEVGAALKLQPKLAKAQLARAIIAMANGNTHQALSALETALALDPHDPVAHMDGAEIAMEMGRPDIAAALACRASDLAPTQFGGLLLAARALYRINPAQSRTYAELALQRAQAELAANPHALRARYALGPLLAMSGDRRTALAAMESLERRATPLEYYRVFGLSLVGDITEALNTLDFLASQGWRHACVMGYDPCLDPVSDLPAFRRLQSELMAA